MMTSNWVLFFSFLMMSLFGSACGSNSSSPSATTVPADVVISSPTEATSSANTSLIKGLLKKLEGDAAGDDFASKKEVLDALIQGNGDCSFTLSIPNPTPPNCYGPSIDYQNHPGVGSGQLPPKDVGIWSEYEGADAEACAAAQMNYLIQNVSSRVDNMISLVGATACAGKKADISLPAIDTVPLDLKSAMEINVDVQGLEVNSATLDRLADTADGDAQYQTTLNVTLTIEAKNYDAEVVLTHIPKNADNTIYRGKISMKFSDETASDQNCNMTGQTGITYVAVILYDKTLTTQVDYQMNYAQFCGADADPFDAGFNIDPADKASGTNIDGWGADWNYGRFRINPETGEGTVMYAWQAGAGDGASRVLNVAINDSNDGSATGDAWYGFGGDVAGDGLGAIEGFVCNWAGPGQDHGVGNYANVGPLALVQYQKLTRVDSTSRFLSSSQDLAITYAPTNSCDYAGGTFTYESTTQDNATLNNVTGSAITNNLKPFSDYESTFTLMTDLEDGI